MSTKLQQELSSLLPISEKQKILNQFVNDVKESEVNDILSNSEGLSSTQHNLLKLSLAERFQRPEFVIELLHSGEKQILNKAAAKRWMYGLNISQLTDSEFLLNQFFPNVSYKCRQNVINKIGRFMQNEEEADKIWNAVDKRYGFNVAAPLLQACTKGKITSVITKHKVRLMGYQVVQILQKYPDVGLEYLKDHYTRTDVGRKTNSYCSPLLYLFENHPDEFVDLLLSHSDKMQCFTFGKHRSIRLIRNYRSKLMEQPRKFNSILQIDPIRREFTAEEFQIFFESTLAENPDHIDTASMMKWVRSIPVDKRLNMIRTAFSKLYQINFDDHPEYINPECIILLPDEKRLSVIQWKQINDKNGIWTFRDLYMYAYRDQEKKFAWTPLKPTSHSVPELQKLLLIEKNVKTRAALSKCLIFTCYINQDLPQLLDVLILLSKRSRNDKAEVRRDIFRAICSTLNSMEFTKEHWDVIIEMIQVSLVFNDAQDYSDYEKETVLQKCVAFHIKSKLAVSNIVSILIKVKMQLRETTWANSYLDNPADKRILLELFVKELQNVQMGNSSTSFGNVPTNPNVSSESIANLIEEISEFNSVVKRSNDVKPILIASHEWLRTRFEQLVKEEEKRINEDTTSTRRPRYSWNFAKQLFKILRSLRCEQKLSLDAFTLSEDLFSKILESSPSEAIFIHFLHKNPSELNQSWSSILSKMLNSESNMRFMGRLKSSNYSTLVAQSIKICSEIVNQKIDKDSTVTTKQKCNAVAVLSILSEPIDFLALTANFYPLETKVDVFAENSGEDYQLRQTFAKSLVNVTISHLALPVIAKFCVGDYLKLVVGSLYSQAARASETKSMEFLRQQLFDTRVSLQKHVIRLFFKICSMEEKSRILSEMDSSNVTIRHEIFLQASNLFRLNWSEETWRVLKSIIEKTTKDDAPAIQYLRSSPNLDTCPPEFLSDYIQACLTVLRKGEASQVDSFMSHLEGVIDKIPEKTLDEIILYKNVEQFTFNYTFCVKYLMSSSTASILSHRISNVWSLLYNAIQNGWDRPSQHDSNGFEYPTRTLVFAFISTLCMQHLNDLSKVWVESQVLQSLLENLKAEFMTKVFKEILYIELSLLLLLETDKKGIEKLKSFGRSLGVFINSLVQKYGGEVISIIYDTVQPFIQHGFAKELDNTNGIVIELIDGILEASESRHNKVTAINLLHAVNPKASNLKVTFEKIRNKLTKSNDVVVQIYYNYVHHKPQASDAI